MEQARNTDETTQDTQVRKEVLPKTQNATASEANTRPCEPISVRLIDDGLKPFEVESLKLARKTYWVALGGLLAAVAAAVFVGSQVRIMSDQTQIISAQSASDAAGASLSAVQVQKQLLIAQIQAQAAQDSANEIDKEMRYDERAWIFPIYHPTPPLLRLNEPIGTILYFPNTGRTPAEHVKMTAKIEVLDTTQSPTFDYSESFTGDHPLITPGEREAPAQFIVEARRRTSTGLESVVFDKNLSGKWYAEQLWVTIEGKLTYDDIFGHSHWLHFCYANHLPRAFMTETAPIKKCVEYNAADGN